VPSSLVSQSSRKVAVQEVRVYYVVMSVEGSDRVTWVVSQWCASDMHRAGASLDWLGSL
jgi:hypothetical protein